MIKLYSAEYDECINTKYIPETISLLKVPSMSSNHKSQHNNPTQDKTIRQEPYKTPPTNLYTSSILINSK